MANFLILSDRPLPGDKERNFKDGNGRYVWHQLYKAGAPMNDLAIEFLYDSDGHNRWRTIEAKHRPKIILAMGQDAIDNFSIDGKALKVRGSVYPLKKRSYDSYVIPTLHPKDIKKPYNLFMEESLEKGFFVAADIRKAVDIYYNGYEEIKENFNIEPTLKDVEEFVENAIENKWLLGLDIEATGLNLEYAEIVVLGFAWSESDAIVIPFKKLHGEEYWNPEEWNYVRFLLEKLFKEGRFIAQNGVGYDIPLLRFRGWNFPLESYVGDTMILHHTIDPAQQHNIGLISSIYGRLAYWKESFLSKKESILETDQRKMKIYNARDCISLHQINNAMLRHMSELGKRDPRYARLPEIYEKGIKVARTVIKMYEKGILLDRNKLTDWHRFVEKDFEKKEKTLKALRPLPESFNYSSGDHLRYLLYGEVPGAWGKKYEEELKFYENDAKNYQYECSHCSRKITKKFYDFEIIPRKISAKCPRCKRVQIANRTDKEPTSVKARSKESKNYKKLMEIKELKTIEPLKKPSRYKPPKTKKGDQSAVDKNALTKFLIALDRRLDEIKSLKRRQPRHEEEKKDLEETRTFVVALLEYGKVSKLKDSFWSFPTWQDGRSRPSFLVTGTATGRFSSKNPNF